jgi:hypothetical protein
MFTKRMDLNTISIISGQDTGRLSIWEVLGIVSTFRQNVERLKLYRATLSVVRFMAVLNFIYTVVGSAFLIIGLSPSVYEAMDINNSQSAQFLKLGKILSFFRRDNQSCLARF